MCDINKYSVYGICVDGGMSMEEQVRELFPGVRLTTLRTDRFHSGFFGIYLLRPLQKEQAARNALLMNVLRRGTRTLPNMEKLSEALDNLYGASLSPYLLQYGETVSTGFHCEFPDDRFLGGEDCLGRMIALGGEALLDPATKGGLLREDYVKAEAQNLHDRVASAVNNKRSYAIKRARQLMFAGEPYGVYPLGEAEDALRIYYQSLTKYYREVLQTSPLSLFYCGSAEPSRVEEAARRAFMILPGFGERVLPEAATARETGELRHVTEKMEVEQGNLVICFRYRRTGPADYPALSVFNEIFGGGPASRLFLNVREKRSLCYSVGSGVDRFKEAMLVAAGIDFDRQEETEEAVFAELKRLAEGDIPEEELEAARRSVATGYLRGLDSPSAICNFRLGQSLLGAGGDLRQYAALSAEVRAEDVAAIAAAMEPGLVYFLRKGAAQ